jgi:hypothetical protein
MKRIVAIALCSCWLVFGGGNVFAANMMKVDPAILREHSDKMKIKNPQKYQSMIERAGGNITHCCSCHVESCAENIPTQQRPTPQPPKKF